MKPIPKPVPKSNFKIIAGSKAPTDRPIRAGGIPAPTNMPAGTYRAICEGAKVATLWGKPTAVLAFRIAEGDFFGVSLLAYFEIELNGEVTAAGCDYNRFCEIALNREVEPGDDLHPARIFTGKIFDVAARFKAASAGKRRESLDPSVHKGAGDFLRVGAVLALVEGL